MSPVLTYGYLADHPAWGEVLARWHHAEWGALMPYWSEADARAEFASHTERHGLPTTLVALRDGVLVGSVSLVARDFEEWAHLTPWLASLYVVPEARGLGVGRELVRRLVEEAALQSVPRLHVIASDSELFYMRLGWTVQERVHLRGHLTALMYLDLPVRM